MATWKPRSKVCRNGGIGRRPGLKIPWDFFSYRFDPGFRHQYIAEWSSLVARRAHNPEVMRFKSHLRNQKNSITHSGDWVLSFWLPRGDGVWTSGPLALWPRSAFRSLALTPFVRTQALKTLSSSKSGAGSIPLPHSKSWSTRLPRNIASSEQ